MKWDRHFAIGLAFAIPSAYFLLASFGSGPLCGSLVGHGFSCGSMIDYETLSIGGVLAFSAVAELFLARIRKRGGDMFWESAAQRLMRQSGILAMLIGAVVGLVMFFRIESLSVSTLAPWNVHGAYGITFYSGLIVVAAGAALILGSRMIRIKPMKVAAAKAFMTV